MASIIHRTFDDPRDYERGVRLARINDLVVSEPGVFKASLTIMNVGRVWLQSGSESLARTVRIAIEDSPRSLVFLADDQVTPVIQSGTEFGAGDVVSFGQNTSHFQRTFGPIRWAGVSLLPGDLEKAVTAIDGRDMGAASTSLYVKPSAGHLVRLRILHREVSRMASSGDEALTHPEVRRSLEQTLVVATVACLTGATEKGQSSGWRRHQQIMQRFLGSGLMRTTIARSICRRSVPRSTSLRQP
jgi:hypothetical protein